MATFPRMRLSFCFLRSAPSSVHPEVASGERHGPQDSRSRGSRPPWGLATDPQVAGPSPRPILTDAVQRAGREVLHPCESGGLRRGWQLVTCSGFPHVSASVIECAIAALVGPPLPHPGGQGPPTWQPPGSLSLAHPPSRSFPRPSAGVGAAAGVSVCVLQPLCRSTTNCTLGCTLPPVLLGPRSEEGTQRLDSASQDSLLPSFGVSTGRPGPEGARRPRPGTGGSAGLRRSALDSPQRQRT